MALPISSSKPAPDIAVSGWGAITVRVAWTLAALRVRIRPEVLQDTREHVILCLPPSTSLTRAEDLATKFTIELMARAQRRQISNHWTADYTMPLSHRWRRALDEGLRPLAQAVLRHHYNYGRPLDMLTNKLEVDRITLEQVRGGIRESVRRVALEDGLPLDTWAPDRLDKLIARIAAHSIHRCPPLHEVAEGCHAELAARCPRLDRTQRLVRSGVLTSDDLVAPSWGARPRHVQRIVGVQLHPDARQHLKALTSEMPVSKHCVDGDLLVLDGEDLEEAGQALAVAAEVGRPEAKSMRGVVIEGPGRWSKLGLLGPLVEQVSEEVGRTPWGAVQGLGELPKVLPPPPSALPVWIASIGLSAVALLAGLAVMQPAPAPTESEFEVEFTPGRGGVWAAFDAAEEAYVFAIRSHGDELQIILSGQELSEKANFAVGDGGYRLHAVGESLLIGAAATPLDDLGPLIHAAKQSEAPLEHLERQLLAQVSRDSMSVGRRNDGSNP